MPAAKNDKHLPSSVGNYAIGGRLGEGTFGTVLKATHKIAGEKVAVKVLEKKRMVQADEIERVGREIQILKMLKHPNVVRLWEIIYTSDQIFLVMEFCARGELFQHIVRNGRLKEEDGRHFVLQILAGVQYLHQSNVVHRDIKPENLLLDENKNIRIVDFGLSTRCAPGQVLQHACGSPCYAAPEMLTREGQKNGYVGHPVDIWSTGVTLYAMLCGFLPFEHANTSALYKKIIAGEYAQPHFLSREARDVLKRFLTTDPKKRWTVPQILQHPWCTKPDAVGQPVRGAGAVAALALETAPDSGLINHIEQKHGISSKTIALHLGEERHSDASATYWLLRLKALREGTSPHTVATRPQSASAGARGLSLGEAERARVLQTAQPQQQQTVHSARAAVQQKENLYSSPAVKRTGAPKTARGSPGGTPKLARSPKPITFNNAGNPETHSSSPAIKIPSQLAAQLAAGAAHAAVRAGQQTRDDATALALAAARARRPYGEVYNQPTEPRPPSTRRAREQAPKSQVPSIATGTVAMAMAMQQTQNATGGANTFRTTAGSPRHAMAATGPISARAGADFRTRKYAVAQQTHAHPPTSARARASMYAR